MTTAMRRYGAVRGEAAARQITELAQAFRAFRASMPELNIEVVGHYAGRRELVHPVAGFHVRMGGSGGTGISLYVSARYAELVRWRADVGALRERFDVHLDDAGYGWGDSTFPSAAELAHDLLAYMQFNLDALPKS